jgi:23S rRNA (adenine2503-C2)-methyltransferase
MSLPYFNDLSFSQWQAVATELGFGPTQMLRFFRAVHADGAETWDEVDAPERQKRKIVKRYDLAPAPEVITRSEATDGTTKFLLRMADGKSVEAVHIPEDDVAQPRGTVCISSQVGCAMNCDFCFTAKMGLDRNLLPHEIVGQWRRLRRELPDKAFTNIVFMGMGEPLHNVENVLAAIDIFTHDYAIGIPARRITVSTSGLLPGIKTLQERSTVRLALSVNGSHSKGRRRVMPVEKAYPIADILDYLRGRDVGNHHHAMFEYVLLGGENDRDEDAHALVRLLDGVPGRINLIPFNAHPGSAYKRPDDEQVYRFHALLRAAGRNVFIRHSRGRDVLAACGQLHHETTRVRKPRAPIPPPISP